MVSPGHRGVTLSGTSIIALRTWQVYEEGSEYESSNTPVSADSPLPLQELSSSQSIYADQ